MKKNFVLTTVGISLLLNSMTSDERNQNWGRILNTSANLTELDSDLEVMTETLTERAAKTLLNGKADQHRRLSAELNGLYGLYEDQLYKGLDDIHVLVTTDTALGRRAAHTIERFMRTQGINNVQRWTPEQLGGATNIQFSHGIKELLRLCDESIPGYQEAGYHVVFNLTAAFKSLQSYLNIAGMFYADEIVYIFEGSDQLLRIPRLPIQVDIEKLHQYRAQLAMLDAGYIGHQDALAGLWEGLLEVDQHGYATLSDWGKLIWNRSRRALLGDDLLAFPGLNYEETFKKDFLRASIDERIQLQQALAKASILLFEGGVARLKQDGGLLYEDYDNKRSKDGRSIGHFRLTLARRVSCIAEANTLYLRHFGNHDQVNNNP